MKHTQRVVVAPLFPRFITALLSIAFLINGSPLAYANLPADKEYKFYYYLHDNLGGIQSVLDDKGNVVCTNDYLPYGEERNGDCMNKEGEDYGYTGKEKDEETGLMYYGARYYDPVIGRFTAQDPLVSDPTLKGEALQKLLTDPQALNPYTYARNNPVKYVDPNGESFMDMTIWFLGSVVFLNTKGYDIAAHFLRHAINLNPFSLNKKKTSNLYFNTTTGDKMSQKIGNQIKKAKEYRSTVLLNIQKEIKNGNLEGRGSGEFKNGTDADLFYAIHVFDYTFKAGEAESGTYDVNIQITDTYNFDKEAWDSLANAANNFALGSQENGGLLNYEITIDMTEKIKIDKQEKGQKKKSDSKK